MFEVVTGIVVVYLNESTVWVWVVTLTEPMIFLAGRLDEEVDRASNYCLERFHLQ